MNAHILDTGPADALWTGSPQWQIEGLRRLEIPEAMQNKFGYAPLGAADGPVKSAIFGGNNARLYDILGAHPETRRGQPGTGRRTCRF